MDLDILPLGLMSMLLDKRLPIVLGSSGLPVHYPSSMTGRMSSARRSLCLEVARSFLIAEYCIISKFPMCFMHRTLPFVLKRDRDMISMYKSIPDVEANAYSQYAQLYNPHSKIIARTTTQDRMLKVSSWFPLITAGHLTQKSVGRVLPGRILRVGVDQQRNNRSHHRGQRVQQLSCWLC